MRAGIIVVACTACGRIGFEPVSTTDGALSAKPPVTLGDRPDTDVAGVTTDTYIDSTQPFDNFGSHSDIHAGNGVVGLLRFDLGSLPPTSVASARLHMFVYYAADSQSTVVVFPLLEDWMEGTGNFTVGIAHVIDRTATATWTTVGAGAPGSRNGNAAGQTGGPFAAGDEIVIDLPATLIEGWLADPLSNHGLVVDTQAGAFLELGSRENPVPTMPPLLALELR